MGSQVGGKQLNRLPKTRQESKQQKQQNRKHEKTFLAPSLLLQLGFMDMTLLRCLPPPARLQSRDQQLRAPTPSHVIRRIELSRTTLVLLVVLSLLSLHNHNHLIDHRGCFSKA